MTYRIDVCSGGSGTDAFQNFIDHTIKIFQSSERYRNKSLMDVMGDELKSAGAKNISESVYIEFEIEDATIFKLKWL
jgi:hypothetical protein